MDKIQGHSIQLPQTIEECHQVIGVNEDDHESRSSGSRIKERESSPCQELITREHAKPDGGSRGRGTLSTPSPTSGRGDNKPERNYQRSREFRE